MSFGESSLTLAELPLSSQRDVEDSPRQINPNCLSQQIRGFDPLTRVHGMGDICTIRPLLRSEVHKELTSLDQAELADELRQAVGLAPSSCTN
jgi:hypothetical protein